MAYYRMKQNLRFALRGVRVMSYRAGEVYDLPDEAAEYVEENELAERVEEPDEPGGEAATETRMRGPAPQNKVLEGPPSNKSPGPGGRRGTGRTGRS